MRVLVLAPRVPYPATFGAAQRNLQITRWLGFRHEVTLIAFGDPTNREATQVLRSHAAAAVIVPPPHRGVVSRATDFLLSAKPDLTRRLWSRSMIRSIRRALRETVFDLVQVEGLEMFAMWQAAQPAGESHPPVVLDAHNAEYALQWSAVAASRSNGAWAGALYSAIQASRLERFERNACHLASGIVTVSPDDEAALSKLRPSARSAVVPNGVDLAEFVPCARVASERVLFLGKMDYRPNVDAADWLRREIWPFVRRELPTACLDIVGRDPLPAVLRLGGADGVSVVGAVPDERVWFQRSALLVIPMRMGSGVRFKALQAMATATPIVSTTLGMAGTSAIDGLHYLGGETPAVLAAQIVKVLRDSALRSRLAEAALALVRDRYDWNTILPRLDDFHRKIIDQR